MTLVAGLSIGGTPAFIGDLLLSWGVPTEVSLPSQPRPGVFKGRDQAYAKELAQKLVIVRPYLLLAWAGSYTSVCALIDHLDRWLPTDVNDLKGRTEALYALMSQFAADGLELVMLIFDGEEIIPLCANTRGIELDGRRIYLLGSGREEFFKFTQWPDETVPDFDTPNGLVLRATMLRFAANAMVWQYGLGHGLSDSWGGGFEVAHVTDVGFMKVDNVLTRAWAIRSDSEVVSSGYSFLQHYEGATLHLTVFGQDNRTFRIPSVVASAPVGDARSKVAVEWTIDIFHDLTSGLITNSVVWDWPGSDGQSIFAFEGGELVGWTIRKQRFQQVLERVRAMHGQRGFHLETLDRHEL